jgi:PPIC-type PPIASE domain/Outer membrane lipoprotein
MIFRGFLSRKGLGHENFSLLHSFMNFPLVGRLFSLFVLALPWGCAHRGPAPTLDQALPLAQIEGQPISEAEFGIYTQTLLQERRVAVSQDPQERRAAFEEFLRKRLYVLAAQKSGHPSLDSLRRRVALLDQQVITQFYQLIFIGENLGFTRKEIEAFYSRNPDQFRDSSGRLPPVDEVLARISDTMALAQADLDSFHRANAANYPPPQPDLRRKLAENYLFETKQIRSENTAAELKAKYRARMIRRFTTPTDAELAAYYEQNKEAYVSLDGFDLYHIESATPKTSETSKALASKVAAIKTLEEFKALAMRVSQNTWTKPLGGRLGVVKRDHCLPYGIGLLPSLFPVLDAAEIGKIAAPLQNQVTGKWHYFWLAGKVPASIKPLDRVKTLVKQDYLTNRLANIKPDDTLALIPGRRAILEKDVSFLRAEYPDQYQDIYTRDNLADFLVEREVIAVESEALGLLEDDRLKASRLENELSFWSGFYLDSLLGPSWNPDTAAMAALFAQKPRVFTKDPQQKNWRLFARDLEAYPLLASKELEIEYGINRELYLRGDSLPPFAEVEHDVFHHLKGEAYRRLDAKRASALKARFKVRIDPSLQEPTYEPPDEVLKQAKDDHRDRKPNRALFLYGKLREKFPNRDTLQFSVGLGMAQIHLEQQRYQQALAEYRRMGLLYPQNPDNYKALFMEGFILAEHFKSDSAAVRTFESMLKKYPGSALAKEAEWMIRNIRSGGTLIPEPVDGG